MSFSFSPAHGAHALTETIFYTQFSPQLSEGALERLGKGDVALLKQMPTRTPLRSIEFRVKEDGENEIIDAMNGAEFLVENEAGEREWVLHATNENISVHCLNYTRWEDVWPFALEALHSALSELSGEVSISSFGLKTVDKFNVEGDLKEYDLKLLLKEDSKLLCPHIFNVGPLWHCNSGWYTEEFNSGHEELPQRKILHQLNVAGASENTPSGSKFGTNIEHNQVFRSASEEPITFSDEGKKWIDTLSKHFHDENKKILSNLLTDEMADLINLFPERK